jgi:inosine-uridine nucleoside N-ribohydrolase
MTYRNIPVEIALAQGPTRGMTVCDFRNLTAAPLENITGMGARNCHVAVEINGAVVVERIVSAITGWSERSSAPSAKKNRSGAAPRS